jgi:hypothetical protein
MMMPGFTAEDSLYQTPCHYVTAANHSSSGVVPQLAINGGWLDVCRAYCECCRYYWGCCWVCWYCAIIISWPETAA